MIKRLAISLLAGAAALVVGLPLADGDPAYSTPIRNNVVLNSVVPITNNKPGNPPPRVVAAQTRLTLDEGDLVLVASTVEGRVNMPYATLVAGFLRYTFNGQFVDPDNPLSDAGIIARPMGWNIWDAPHYRVDLREAHFVAPASGVYVFQHVVYGVSSAYTGDLDDHIDVVYAEQYFTVFHNN